MYLFPNYLMPLSGNVIVPEGIGPIALRDAALLRLSHLAPLPSWFWMLVTLLAVLGGVGLFAYLLWIAITFVSDRALIRQKPGRILALFFLSGALVYFLPVIFQGTMDRYFLPLIVLLALSFVGVAKPSERRISKNRKVAAMLLLGCLALFSVTATHDYLAWNKARWKAIRRLLERDEVRPAQIDGGFEFNGLYMYSPYYQRSKGKSWWWVRDDMYMLAFGPVSGYEIIDQEDFAHWLRLGEGRIVVLKRQDEATVDKETQENPSQTHKNF
jgi:hypothetical protein